MLRGNRGVILAAVGWLSLSAANHPDTKAQQEQAQAEKAIAHHLADLSAAYQTERAETAKAPKETGPCGPRQYGGNADLCAQWKAADAAADSAWWAWAGGILGIASLFGVIIAIGLTFWSNWIARDTARRQLRPYVSIDPKGIHSRDEQGMEVACLLLHNAGQTPAYDICVHCWFTLEEDPVNFNVADRISEMPEDSDGTDIVIPPGEGHHIYNGLPFALLHETGVRIAEKELAIVHYGFVTYRDGFGRWWQTNFAHYHRGDELSDATAKRCRRGNGAT